MYQVTLSFVLRNIVVSVFFLCSKTGKLIIWFVIPITVWFSLRCAQNLHFELGNRRTFILIQQHIITQIEDSDN
jgi:hypothetical protein